MNAETNTFNGNNGGMLKVSLVYMVVGFVVFLLMGLLGLLMRLNHAGIFLLPSDWFYRIMTLHGSGMVAASLLFSMGGFAAVLSKSVKLSPRILWTAFFIYFLGAGFVIIATLIGGFGAGWTVLHPLPYQSGGAWGLWAAIAMYLGYLFVAVGFLLYCLNMLYAVVVKYGGLGKALAWEYLFSGGRKGGDNLPSPVELVAAVVAIDGAITVVAGAILLIPMFANAAGLIEVVDALFAKNLLFLFGHTLVNLNIYLAAGLVYAILPVYTNRKWETKWPVALALNLVIILVLLPYFHHLYQDFSQNFFLHVVGVIGSYGVAIPAFVVTIIGSMALIYRSGMRWAVPSVLIALGLWGWTFGGMGALLDSTIPVNQVMHNTQWVVGHFHTYYLMGAVAFSLGYMYHLINELSHSEESGTSRMAAWLYGLGSAGFLLMFFLSGANSVPRRYATYLPDWHTYPTVAVVFVLILTVGLLILTLEMLGRLKGAWQGTSG